MTLTDFNGAGVGFGFGVGCGFGVGWGFGGTRMLKMGSCLNDNSKRNYSSLSLGSFSQFPTTDYDVTKISIYSKNNEGKDQHRMPLRFLGLGAGGGCGIGLGLGWGFGSAFGSQYHNSRITFRGEAFEGKTSEGSVSKNLL